MKIAEGHDVSLCFFDIETLTECLDIGLLTEKGEWIEFEVSRYRNDLYKFNNFYTRHQFDYWVSFNGIGFDHQVLQYVLVNHGDWFDLTPMEICQKVHDFVQSLIESQDYGKFLPYRESSFPVKPIDVFKIHHFDNEAKRTSLKHCAYMMNLDVEEMPIDHNKRDLSENEISIIKDYRRNDVLVTKEVFLLTLGQIELPEMELWYKGKNKIQDRFDVESETGLKCLNWSDVKIGEEWNKLDYRLSQGIKEQEEYLLFPKNVVYPYGKKFRQFFPKTMKFTTELLQNFVKDLGEKFVLAQAQEFPITIGETKYMIRKGGIHSEDPNRAIIPPAGYSLTDIDVQSQYPNAFLKFEACPPHLKPILYSQVEKKVETRVTRKNIGNKLKAEGKKDEARPHMSVQEMLKLALNGGLYGKLGQEGSFLSYPAGGLKICMGNQIEILMLIEMMEEAGFKVISGNTDGIMVLYPTDKRETFLKICTDWEEKVGNIKLGKLEHTEFEALWQNNINAYIGKKKDGTFKKKGSFLTEYKLNESKNKRIVALALEAFFSEGKDPVEFIKNHTNIFDFCIEKKAFGKLHYEEIIAGYKAPIKQKVDAQDWNPRPDIVDTSAEKIIVHKKMIRYYVCNSGNIFKKRGITQTGNDMDNHCEALNKNFPQLGQPKLKYFNKVEVKPFKEYDVNYDYYIVDCLERIDKILKTKKAKSYVESIGPTSQGSLF